MKKPSVCVIVGAQWGDEGKGKITHYLADHAHLVARFGGGNNAGHTISFGGEKFKLHHVPSGIFFQDKLCILGNGMVIDPQVLTEELEGLRKRGIGGENIRISDRAHIIMPYHRYIDRKQEETRGKHMLGTTGRGIGPAYTDKVARSGIRASDLLDSELFMEKIIINLKEKEALLEGSGLTAEGIIAQYEPYIEAMKSSITDTSLILYEAIKKGKKILMEGAQGALLDLDFGTYPFITSSNAIAGNASVGAGIPPWSISQVVGISKAYTTRVGTGPFPTELNDDNGGHLLKVGAEYGTTTGRARRCGWLDAVILRFAVRINGITELALTKLDVLSGIDPLNIAVAYRHRGKRLENFPADMKVLAECEPEYIQMKGWTGDISGVREIAALPQAARDYMKKIEELLEVPVTIVSVGADRDQTIVAPFSLLSVSS
ncbi:MAG: adenylosuccinate synthase [Candidatus Eremiobacteraeota bacterium]|nr:adenylosuccinate synthase [Candidatus Eremiobacteraeota bacterium]